MKKSFTLYSFVLILLLSLSTIFAKEQSNSEYSTIEQNLIVGLSSDNIGLKLSAAYFLGEIKSEEAILPLMAMLHCAKNKQAQQVAALALYKINSERGMFAIKQAIKFADDGQTRRICTIFYNQHLQRDKEGKVEVEPIFITNNLKFGEYRLSDFTM
jgi:hypothetical protein